MIISLEIYRREQERPSKEWRRRFVFIQACTFEDGKRRLVFLQAMQTRVSWRMGRRVWKKPE